MGFDTQRSFNNRVMLINNRGYATILSTLYRRSIRVDAIFIGLDYLMRASSRSEPGYMRASRHHNGHFECGC